MGLGSRLRWMGIGPMWLALPLAAQIRYVIAGILDPARNEIRGTVRFCCRNPTPAALQAVQIRSYGGISRVTDSAGQTLRFQPKYLLLSDAIVLAKPLPPGASVELDIAFTAP